MASLPGALAGGLIAPPPPRDGSLVAYAGGKRALVQAISGLSSSPQRRDYATAAEFEADRRKWRTASRRVQRHDTTAGQRRESFKLTSAESRRVRGATTGRRLEAVRRRGLRARMTVRLRVDTPSARRAADDRVRTLPAGGPGVLIDPGTVREILEAMRESPDMGAGMFREAFFDAYGMPDDFEISDVLELSTWPEGTEEPAGRS